jgi:putative protease
MPLNRKEVEIMADKPIGKVTHYFDKISVAVIALDANLKEGDKIKIGKGEDFVEQEVKSMQVEHEKIPKAKAGQEVGMKVDGKVKEGDLVFKA